MPTRLSAISVALMTLFFLALISLAKAQNQYIYEHANCQVRIKKDSSESSYLSREMAELLKSRQYKVNFLIDNKKILPGELYALLKVTHPKGKLWRDCIVDMKLKQAKGRILSPKDTILFQKQIRRRVPRVTFGGKERCIRALKETFIHIPYCQSVGYMKTKSTPK